MKYATYKMNNHTAGSLFLQLGHAGHKVIPLLDTVFDAKFQRLDIEVFFIMYEDAKIVQFS